MFNRHGWKKDGNVYRFVPCKNAIGWHLHGFDVQNDKTDNFLGYYGLAIDFKPLNEPADITITFKNYSNTMQLNRETVYEPSLRLAIPAGKGSVTAPFELFDYKKAQSWVWKFVSEFRIDGGVQIEGIRLVEAASVAMKAKVYSKMVEAGQEAEYEITVKNCTTEEMCVSLFTEQVGWETAVCTLSHNTLMLKPEQAQVVYLRVLVTDEIVPGGHEKQTIVAVANGDGASCARLEFYTGRRLPHPYIIHDKSGWDWVRKKYAMYDWAKKDAERYIGIADTWKHQMLPKGSHGLCETIHSEYCMNTAVAYMITGKREYAEKCRAFILDVFKDYAETKQACHQSLVQEGHFFQHTMMAYDIALAAGMFSEEEQARIEQGVRVYMSIIDNELNGGNISNWHLSEMAGALYCAMVLQDIQQIERFVYGTGGVLEHLSKGVLDDGWWYECSLGYHVWVCGMFLQMAFACEKFGYSILHQKVKPSYSRFIETRRQDLYGVKNEAWGKKTKNYRNIELLLDSMLPFVDYRGVVFGMNDSMEGEIKMRRHGIYPYELAYLLFKKPEYGDIVLLNDDRDVLYGAEEVTGCKEKLYAKSACAHNAGAAVLRSQAGGRKPEEQIQAVIKYGSHGGYHGHFDRTSLTSLMRYGRSVYNPEIVWYGYGSYMYKFYTQNSLAHNMVVVDGKNQEAQPCTARIFYSGKKMQVFDVEVAARWSNPPYGGMFYGPNESFPQKALEEGRSLPIPENPPAYGELTGFTEPVYQRRCTVLTDDYLIIYDCLKGETEHTYDNMLHICGLRSVDGKFVKQMPQLDESPLSSGQFITNCMVYDCEAPSTIKFDMDFEPDPNDELRRLSIEQHGRMNIDVHNLQPQRAEVIIGTTPINREIRKRVKYKVELDGEVRASGDFGAWVLGTETINVDLKDKEKLTLRLTASVFRNFLDGVSKDVKGLYLGDAVITTSSGKKIPLAETEYKAVNVAGSNLDEAIMAGRIYKNPVAVTPEDYSKEAVIELDLKGLDVQGFSAVIGANYPPYKDENERKTVAIRQRGVTGEFITLIEPYEGKSMIKKAYSDGPGKAVVELADGRTQTVEFKEDSIVLQEFKNGTTVMEEAKIN